LRRPLRSEKERVAGWKIPDDGFDALADGIRQAYRRGRKLAAQACDHADHADHADHPDHPDHPDDEVLHAWRRRAKDLRYQVASLAAIRPRKMARLEKRLHRLTDLLGEDHDLAALRQSLGGRRNRPGPLRPVLRFLDRRRRELEREACSIGDAIYASSARKFVAGLRADWEAWRAQGERSS
jgi:CHAD domain-containing protein